MKQRVLALFTISAVLVMVVAQTALPSGKPVIERISVDETFQDEFLTAACGFEVTTRAKGHFIERTFPDGGTGLTFLNTVNIALTATANGNSYSFRDVGADMIRITSDGTAVLMVVGQLPFAFTGVLKIDLETEDAILEPQHSTEDDIETACSTLEG